MSLPGADELFRATIEDDADTPAPHESASGAEAPHEPARSEPAREASASRESASDSTAPSTSGRRASGRVRHDEKMTVYVTAEELLEIEHARIALRRSLGGAVDRGRLVRAAMAMALADLDANGDDSDLVRRLREA